MTTDVPDENAPLSALLGQDVPVSALPLDKGNGLDRGNGLDEGNGHVAEVIQLLHRLERIRRLSERATHCREKAGQLPLADINLPSAEYATEAARIERKRTQLLEASVKARMAADQLSASYGAAAKLARTEGRRVHELPTKDQKALAKHVGPDHWPRVQAAIRLAAEAAQRIDRDQGPRLL